MTEERRISEIEDMLREAGAPPTPPAHFHAAARQAALGHPQVEVVDIRSRVRPSSRFGRIALAAAVLTASAAAALVIGVGGNNFKVDRSLQLQAAAAAGGAATATVDIGTADGPVRQVAVHVKHLAPAPRGGYYELWMQDGTSDPTGMVAFDTGSGGDVVAKTTMPSGMGWTRCWVTLERADGTETTVLKLA